MRGVTKWWISPILSFFLSSLIQATFVGFISNFCVVVNVDRQMIAPLLFFLLSIYYIKFHSKGLPHSISLQKKANYANVTNCYFLHGRMGYISGEKREEVLCAYLWRLTATLVTLKKMKNADLTHSIHLRRSAHWL